MPDMSGPERFVTYYNDLPLDFPTHYHDPKFWEALGRTVATFGFLEETLGRAIFAFTATRPIPEAEIDEAFEKWLLTLQRALSDALSGLITSYDSAVRAHPSATITNLDALVDDLRKAADVRNVLSHGSWRPPDIEGRAIPLFVNRKGEMFETAVDIAFLDQTRKHVVELTVAVINTVTHMGWQFPGSSGPGKPILSK